LPLVPKRTYRSNSPSTSSFLFQSYESRNNLLHMRTKNIYEFETYKDYLKFRIAEEDPKWGLMTRLASAAGCLRPYISRVLSTECHLTPSQAFGLAQYWNLDDDESEYFLALLEIERAASVPYRQHLQQKLSSAKKRNESLTHIVNRKAAQVDQQDVT